METLNGKNIEKIDFQNSLIRIADVQNFEGPLLTLFENTLDKHLYLFDWVDKDVQFNRWIIYRCKVNVLHKFIKSEISHYNLLMSDEYSCYTVDIDKNMNWNNVQLIAKKHLPESYLPQKEVFFEKSDCPNIQKLEEFIGQIKLNHKKQKDLVKKAFLQGLERSIGVVKRHGKREIAFEL
jgi:hypothetical protein